MCSWGILHPLYYSGGGKDGLDNSLNLFVLAFHMPLFIGVSGWLFYNTVQRHGTKDIVLRRLKGIGVVILVWGLVYSARDIVSCAIKGDLIGIFTEYSGHLFSYWFLWAVLFSNLIHLILVKTIKNKWRYLAIVIITFCLMLLPQDKAHIAFMYPFFAFAYELHAVGSKVYERKYIVVLSVVLWILMAMKFDRTYTVYEAENCILLGGLSTLYLYMFRFVIGMISGLTVYTFGCWVYEKAKDSKCVKIFVDAGKYSLELYVVHALLMEVFKRAFALIYTYRDYSAILDMTWLFNIVICPLMSFGLMVILICCIKCIYKCKLLKFWIFGIKNIVKKEDF